jgi:hypothetical protein
LEFYPGHKRGQVTFLDIVQHVSNFTHTKLRPFAVIVC